MFSVKMSVVFLLRAFLFFCLLFLDMQYFFGNLTYSPRVLYMSGPYSPFLFTIVILDIFGLLSPAWARGRLFTLRCVRLIFSILHIMLWKITSYSFLSCSCSFHYLCSMFFSQNVIPAAPSQWWSFFARPLIVLIRSLNWYSFKRSQPPPVLCWISTVGLCLGCSRFSESTCGVFPKRWLQVGRVRARLLRLTF